MTIDLTTPQARVAEEFMRNKGITLKPYDVEELEGTPCWYFYYDMEEGELELEVFWSERTGWEAAVTAFPSNTTWAS